MNEKANDRYSVFDTNDNVIGKRIHTVPKPSPQIGIALDNDGLVDTIVESGDASTIDIGTLENFTNVSQSRNEVYNLIDTMCEDARIGAIIELYSADATETNDQGQIVWAESDNPEITSYITYLLDSCRVDKHIYSWANCLIKYGDVYLRLYRKSEVENDLFADNKAIEEQDELQKKSKTLNEAINLVKFHADDDYITYVEKVSNPAEMFELTRFGKTAGYIQSLSPLNTVKTDFYNNSTYKYSFKKDDINIYNATEFVHGCLSTGNTRSPEEVSIFLDDKAWDSNSANYTYTINKGDSVLANTFKVWRELQLLEYAIMLNRVTKSSIIRAVQVEVGAMPKSSVTTTLQRIKQLIEQKSAVDTGKSMNEYTSAGAIENNIYIPTRNGVGALTIQSLGGDVDIKSLVDLDYFKDKLYTSARVPKQFFNDTSDSTGFNGGTSLSIIYSPYAKEVKRIQNALVQMVTDFINLMLIDRGMSRYINKFTIKMQSPTTQEEIDRRENKSNQIQSISDIMQVLSDVDDTTARLKIAGSLLSDVLTDSTAIKTLQDYIEKVQDKATAQEETTEEPPDDSESNELMNSPLDFGNSTEQQEEEPTEEVTVSTEQEPNEDSALPTAQDLNVDLTNM